MQSFTQTELLSYELTTGNFLQQWKLTPRNPNLLLSFHKMSLCVLAISMMSTRQFDA